MSSIRKFVGYTSAAAATGAVLALVAFAQTGLAAERHAPVANDAIAPVAAPSAACTSAIQALKAAIVADRTEDAAEREVAKTNAGEAGDQNEDTAERASFRAMFGAIRTACVTSRPALTTFTRSAQCTAAMQAVKAAWAQGRPATRAQWTQLFTLLKAARTACGWSWADRR